MVQSESSNVERVIPKRSYGVEFVVGLFTVISLAAIAYLSVNLAGMEIFGSGDAYKINAQFDNISGLENGASVEIAGVKIGNVVGIHLDKDNPDVAEVEMRIDGVGIKSDDIASIRTKGIIGDRYVKITRGGSEEYLHDGDTIMDTESVVDIEDLVGKLIHNFSSDDSEKEE